MYSENVSSALIPTAPTMYAGFIVILGIFDSSSVTFTSAIKMRYSWSSSVIGRLHWWKNKKYPAESCQGAWHPLVLLLDLQKMEKSISAPEVLFLVDGCASEVKYETKIEVFDCKMTVQSPIALCITLQEWHVQIKKPYRMELIDYPTKVFVCQPI